jgi:hypothetical protein
VARLEARAGLAADESTAFTVRRVGRTLWLLPPELADRPIGIARAGRAEAFHLTEVAQRLPAGGLARGWLDPRALREHLRHGVAGTRPLLTEWIADLAAAELEAVRAAGFRREVKPQGVLTDSVWSFHRDVLPSEVLDALAANPAPARLPDTLPPGVVAMAAFRPEPEASLAWLRHVAERSPRGSMRNLDFWIEEFEARTGRDVEHDLTTLLGDQGWAMAFEDADDGTVEIAAACEVRDAEGSEAALLDLRDHLMEHTLGRSLGMVVPRAREGRLGGYPLHATTLRTLFGEVDGPVFLVTDRHALVATGETALSRALRLLEEEPSWTPVEMEAGLPSPPHEAFRVRVDALAPMVETLIGAHGPEGSAPVLAEAASGLLTHFEAAEIGIWYEEEALRVSSHVRFARR